jgi:hypothetical protein
MNARTPPVPPENQSDKGKASKPATEQERSIEKKGEPGRGDSDNIEQNTRNQGYQQDR